MEVNLGRDGKWRVRFTGSGRKYDKYVNGQWKQGAKIRKPKNFKARIDNALDKRKDIEWHGIVKYRYQVTVKTKAGKEEKVVNRDETYQTRGTSLKAVREDLQDYLKDLEEQVVLADYTETFIILNEEIVPMQKTGDSILDMPMTRPDMQMFLEAYGEGLRDYTKEHCVRNNISANFIDKKFSLYDDDRLFQQFQKIHKHIHPDAKDLEPDDPITPRCVVELAKLHRFNLYIVDAFTKDKFHVFYAVKVDKKLPSLVIAPYDNHMFIFNDTSITKSIANQGKGNLNMRTEKYAPKPIENEIVTSNLKTIKSIVAKDEPVTICVDDPDSLPLERVARALGWQNLASMRGFRIGLKGELNELHWKKYIRIINMPNYELVKEGCRLLNIPFTGQSIMAVAQAMFPGMPKSTYSPSIYQNTKAKGGYYFCLNQFDPDDPELNGMDYNMSYFTIMMQMTYDFPIFTVFDEVEPYDGEPLTPGCYYAVPEAKGFVNQLPFKGANWYGHAFLLECDKLGVAYKLHYQQRAKRTLPAHYFGVRLKSLIKDKTPTELKTISMMAMFLIGCMARTVTTNKRVKLHTSLESATLDNFNNNVFTHRVDGGIYATTAITEYPLKGDNRPISNQIIEMQYIRLYQLTQKMGGDLIAWKTDCVLTHGGKRLKEKPGIGGYKRQVPKFGGLTEETQKNYKPKIFVPDFPCTFDIVEKTPIYHIEDPKTKSKKKKKELEKPTVYLTKYPDRRDIIGDSDIDTANKYIRSGLGALMYIAAGYGKSELIRILCELLGDRAVKLAPTNKAANNIDGKTLHKYFGINDKEEFMFNQKVPEYVIVDEVSLLTTPLIASLVHVKRQYPETKMLLSGDYQQCTSVDREARYNPDSKPNSEVIRYLTDNQRIILTTYHRGNKQMHINCELLRNNIIPSDLQYLKGNFEKYRLHVCKTHVLRMKLNQYLMDRQQFSRSGHKREMLVKCNTSSWKQQDARLTYGTPISAKIKHGKFRKNERYEIEKFHVGNKKIWIKNDAEESIEYKASDFHKYFTVAFAVIVDSIQCESILEPFCIWEFDSMDRNDRYTAYSRGRQPEDVFIAKSRELQKVTCNNLEIHSKIIHNISARKGFQKKHLKCSWNDLIDKFCDQLKEKGLAFCDYGKSWAVDHREPEKDFDTSDPAQCAILYHCDNLQVLSVEENCSKGGTTQ